MHVETSLLSNVLTENPEITKSDSQGALSGRVVSLDTKSIKTALIEHLEIFADETGYINHTSLFKKFREFRMGFFEANKYALFMSVGLGSLVHKNPLAPVNVNDLAQFTTISDPACFKPDGSIDEDGLNKLLSYAQPGKDFLSELDIKKMISEVKFKETIRIPKAILIQGVSNSWDLLKRLATDHYEKIGGTYVPCLTKATINQYIRDSKGLFKRVIDGELPVTEPS